MSRDLALGFAAGVLCNELESIASCSDWGVEPGRKWTAGLRLKARHQSGGAVKVVAPRERGAWAAAYYISVDGLVPVVMSVGMTSHRLAGSWPGRYHAISCHGRDNEFGG